MSIIPRRPVLTVLGTILLVGSVPSNAPAQAPATFNVGGGFGGDNLPWLPPSGMWAEVLSATPKWIVLQTADGKQFPVSYNNVGMFVIRWPSAPGRLSPGAWLEVTGIDLGTNQVMANHVDVYEGAARNLVSPASLYLMGFNRVMTQYDIGHMNTFGTDYSMFPGEELLPRRRHIVGPVASIIPLSIAVGGNIATSIVPAGGGFSMTQITMGTSGYVRQGDLVWFVSNGANHRTLNLSQLIVYKTIPIEQFIP
ncbi:hypothetical protein BH23PLA1_BH23PLA1_05830 [soil metagenome]